MVVPEDQVVAKNEEAMFHCHFTAVPPPTLEWYHENELLANKSRYVLDIIQSRYMFASSHLYLIRFPAQRQVTLQVISCFLSL